MSSTQIGDLPSNNDLLKRIAEGIDEMTQGGPTAEVTKEDGVATITLADYRGVTQVTISDGAKGDKGDTGPQGPSGYVLTENDKVDIAGRVRPTVVELDAPTTLTLADATEYHLTNVSDLTISYPSGAFDCWLRITTVSTGTVTISLPTSQFVGVMPTFDLGETWELSIRDGVIVAGKVES